MSKYRVIVMRDTDGEDALKGDVLFELAGSASLVSRLAPGALIEALSGGEAAQDEPDVPAVNPPGHYRPLADRVFDSAVAAGNAAEAQQNGAEAPKRKRRTKAEIAADTEAQNLGFRDAAHRVQVEADRTVAAGVAASPVPADYVPPAGEAVAGSVPGPVVTEAPAAGPGPVGPDGQPWNPFAQ